MKIIFNDATELQIQEAYIDPAGGLRIKTISATQEQLKELFSEQAKTRKMVIWERGQMITEYKNYTQLEGIMTYTAGFLEPVLYKVGETLEEKVQELQEEKKVLLEQIDMLTQCVLEMSETVYQ